MEKKERCVVFGITPNLTFAVANVILAIENYTPDFIDEYVILSDYNDPLDEDEVLTLKKICPRIRVMPLFHQGNVVIDKKLIQRYSIFNYLGKLEVLRLLDFYHKVLFLDADLLITDSIEAIFYNESIAWRRTILPLSKYISAWEEKEITDEYTIPNGGVILVTDKLFNYHNLYEDALNLLDKIANMPCSQQMGLDELVFAVLNFKYNLGAKVLDDKYNLPTIWRNSQKAVISHSAGTKKYWNDALTYILFPQWGYFHELYIELGGKYNKLKLNRVSDIGKDARGLFIAFNNYDYWQKLTLNLSFSNDIIQSHNHFKSYIQFYIKNVDRSIHYELTKLSNKRVRVALHFERKSLDYINTNLEFALEVKSLGRMIDFENKTTDSCFMLYKEVDEKQSIDSLHKLIAKTISFVILKRAGRLRYKAKIKYYAKYFYRKYLK